MPLRPSAARLFAALALGLAALAPAAAQMEVELAKQYFGQGEFEKAAELYADLHDAQPTNDFYLQRYLESLQRAERYPEAERAIKRALKANPANVSLYVQRGLIHEARGEQERADKIYAEALKRLPPERFAVQKLANAYSRAAKYELAVGAYERGGELLGDDGLFAYNLGALYQQLNDEERMVANYLRALADKPQRLGSVQSILARYLDADGYARVQQAILRAVQGDPDNDTLTELLVWTYVQQGDYRSAMRQVRALDLRRREDGQRIFQLAQTALNERQYDAAREGFDYVAEQKGERSPYYVESRRLSLEAGRAALEAAPRFDAAAFAELEGRYEAFLAEAGVNSATAPVARELALLQAYRLGKRPAAIARLEEVLRFALADEFAARVKLDLADFYLMEGERWEATLLYGQVDKAFPEARLGHEARFRNARLSYYASDFAWAQEQFDVLKGATSRLIANDAIEMSVFIMDNLALETSAAPLTLYAEAELLGFQSDFDGAFAKLDSLEALFPDNGLEDDVEFARAELYRQLGDFALAARHYRRVVDEFPEEIRADNALFALAELTERQLGKPDQARELYQRLFLEYDSSVLATEARKRFRRLRGDAVG